MSDLTLVDLIANGTMSAEVGATLSAVGAEGHSLLVAAVPRAAGKSTVTDAIIDCRPAGVPRHELTGDVSQMDGLIADKLGGYVVVAEFAPHDRGSYMWGARARRALETAQAGYSIASSLHAPSMEEALSLVWGGIEAGDELTSVFKFVVYIERFGEGAPDGPNNFWRRVATVHELDSVSNGEPNTRLLFRWTEADDTFEGVEAPKLLATNAATLAERAVEFQALADAGRTSAQDLRAAVG